VSGAFDHIEDAATSCSREKERKRGERERKSETSLIPFVAQVVGSLSVSL
jgi:hypothetical protein